MLTREERQELEADYKVESSTIECTLATRQSTHGDFTTQAETSQQFKTQCRTTLNWNTLTPDKQEAIDMIVHKLARILSGDSDFVDSWRDIEGYAALVRKQLESSGAKDVRQEYFNH